MAMRQSDGLNQILFTHFDHAGLCLGGRSRKRHCGVVVLFLRNDKIPLLQSFTYVEDALLKSITRLKKQASSGAGREPVDLILITPSRCRPGLYLTASLVCSRGQDAKANSR